jgi:hypothetical protein
MWVVLISPPPLVISKEHSKYLFFPFADLVPFATYS